MFHLPSSYFIIINHPARLSCHTCYIISTSFIDMRILITGADGMLGESLFAQLKRKIIYYSHSRIQKKQRLNPFGNYGSRASRKIITTHKPDIIIHLAALTNVDYCEEHPSEAFRVNFEATKNIVSICKKKTFTSILCQPARCFPGRRKRPILKMMFAAPSMCTARQNYKPKAEVKNYPHTVSSAPVG